MKIHKKVILMGLFGDSHSLKNWGEKSTRSRIKSIFHFSFFFHLISPTFLHPFFFPQAPWGKSMLELDSGVRFSSSPAWGQKHDLWHQSSSSWLNSLSCWLIRYHLPGHHQHSDLLSDHLQHEHGSFGKTGREGACWQSCGHVCNWLVPEKRCVKMKFAL